MTRVRPVVTGAKGNQYNLQDARPVFEVVEGAGGLYIGARRRRGWQLLLAHPQYVLPCFTMIAPRGGHTVHGHFWIPIDERCWAWSYDYHPTARSPMPNAGRCRRTWASIAGSCPGLRPLPRGHDYLIDRDAQRRGETYSGVKGIAIQDGSLEEAWG